jgi:protein SCO1
MRSICFWVVVIALSLAANAASVLAKTSTPAQGSASEQGPSASPPSVQRENADRAYFSDRILITQDGKALRFYTDLLKDKTVLIQFMYTQCQEACPLTTQQLAETQPLLGQRLGKDIFFLSFSVDPGTDTPALLQEYSRRFKAGPGWLFLTGKKDDMDAVTHQLGQVSPYIEGHLPIFIIGNVLTGHWMKLQPYTTPAAIARELLSLADERG